jgi:hypothetical protein
MTWLHMRMEYAHLAKLFHGKHYLLSGRKDECLLFSVGSASKLRRSPVFVHTAGIEFARHRLLESAWRQIRMRSALAAERDKRSSV